MSDSTPSRYYFKPIRVMPMVKYYFKPVMEPAFNLQDRIVTEVMSYFKTTIILHYFLTSLEDDILEGQQIRFLYGQEAPI